MHVVSRSLICTTLNALQMKTVSSWLRFGHHSFVFTTLDVLLLKVVVWTSLLIVFANSVTLVPQFLPMLASIGVTRMFFLAKLHQFCNSTR